VAIDVGGTFTDVVAVDGGGLRHFKVPTTPADPTTGVLDALARLSRQAERLAHGTTVATNTLLTRTGARVGLVATEGFRDILEIGRQNRPRLYERHVARPSPLVSRPLRHEVDERIGPTGEVERALQPRTVLSVAEGLKVAGVEAVAVCLLHSYANRAHEDVVAARLTEILGVPVVCSADVAPEFREFERTSTTVLSAYLGQKVSGYLGRLQEAVKVPVDVMLSSGGLMDARDAGGHAAALLLSGPAGGAHAAAVVAAASGFPSAISFDVGGTSTDVCLVRDGAPEWSADHVVDGYPCRLPALSIHTVGAGGGSAAWLDDGGALRVGPESAGADPGPVAYGRGGTAVTLTDAHLVLGRLPRALPGLKELDVDGARSALSALGRTAGLDAMATASGVVEVATVHVVRALRRVSVERGIDPTNLPLVAFGGAGPLHVADLAARLGAPVAVVPLRAGVLSALGLLLAPPRYDAVVTVLGPLADDSRLERASRQAAARARMGQGRSDADYALWAECRYRGQSHELAVAVRSPDEATAAVRARFDEEHARRNGFARPDAEVELVVVRASVTGDPALSLSDIPVHPAGATASPTHSREVVWEERPVATPIYRRGDLGAGVVVEGPAVVEDEDTTVPLPPGVTAEVDERGSLLVRWRG